MALHSFTLSCLFCIVFVLSQAALPQWEVLVLGISIACYAAYRIPGLTPLVAGILLALAALGGALHTVYSSQLNASQISTDLRLRLRISDVPVNTSYGVRFRAQVIRCESCKLAFGPKNIVLNRYSHAQKPAAGEVWEMTVRLKPISALRNPGSFDRAQWSLANALHAQGYVRNQPDAIIIAAASISSISAMRQRLSEKVHQNPSANHAAGLIEALTLGIKSGIDDATWTLLRDTGTSHLLAISGLHITLLAGWAFWSARLVLSHLASLSCCQQWVLDVRAIALLISLLCALAYALLAGFGLPVQRALLMLLVWVIASWRFRSLSPLTGLSLAMLLILSTNVFSPLSAGLWLSFGTVFAIFFLHRGHQSGQPASINDEGRPGLIDRLRRCQQQLRVAFRTHGLLGLTLLPVTAWFFQSGSLVSPIANLVAVPFVGVVVVPLCFVTVLASAIVGEKADLFLIATQWSVETLIGFLQWVSLLNYSSLSLAVPSPGIMALCLAGVAVALSPRGCGLRWFACPLILPAVLFNTQSTKLDGFEVHVLDVGQGLAALVVTNNQTLLFDTGGKFNGSHSMFEAVVMPYLHTIGRSRVDTLVVSHGDEDHAFGFDDVVRRFPDARIVAGSGLSTEQQQRVEPCIAGMAWTTDDVHFSIVHPGATDKGSDNNRSCVLLVHAGASRALLTGDIERAAERILSRRLGRFPVDLMIAPHHGSNTSSTAELLSQLSPGHVVFPAGDNNRYGFPHAAVQLRYKLSGTRQYTTGTLGAMSFAFGANGLLGEPVTWWQTRRRFWHGFINPACSELFAERALVVRELTLAQKGYSLCGK